MNVMHRFQPMDIPTSEYEQPRHVFDLCRWINEKLSEMQELPDFETIYFERKTAISVNVKKFLEEAIPVACLGLHFYRPEDSVRIKCFAGSQGYDAKLWVSGYRNFEIDIEVTTTETPESVMNRQSLSWNGYAYPGSPAQKQDEVSSTNLRCQTFWNSTTAGSMSPSNGICQRPRRAMARIPQS